MAEAARSSQQTQCPSAADFIFLDERGLELAQPRDYSDYFVSVNQTGADAPREITFDSDAHLLSGKSVSLEVEADASIESLKQCAQSALAVGRGRLLNSLMLRIKRLSGEEVTSVHLSELSDVKALKQRLHQQHGLPPRFR
ncbi:ilvG [Symbiodinium sp. CCMP2592]|nr:ilvG [Symbiodinium sp. CCMP2592]